MFELFALFVWSTLQTASGFYGGGFTYSLLSEINGYYKVKVNAAETIMHNGKAKYVIYKTRFGLKLNLRMSDFMYLFHDIDICIFFNLSLFMQGYHSLRKRSCALARAWVCYPTLFPRKKKKKNGGLRFWGI